jgi:predicted  nucleic acid-binding Zn-ribbon protein
VVRRVGRALFICLFSAAFVGVLPAQDDDPSEIFLKAYLSAQQGEKLEHENRFKSALAKFRFAGSLIEELRKAHPDWQPAIVEYRGRKIGDGILRVHARMSRQNDLSAASSPLPEIVPSLPENEAWSEPGPEVVAPQGVDTPAQGSSDTSMEEATRRLRRKVDQLQAAVDKSRSDLETTRKDKEAVNTRLEETSSKLADAQKEIERRRESEQQARDQLAQTQTLQGSSTEQLRMQIADLKNEVAAAEEARATAERQRDETNAKLAEAGKQIVALEQQRGAALAQLRAGNETEQLTQVHFAENGEFELKLEDRATKESADRDSTSAWDVTGVKLEVAQLQQQLTESQKQNRYLMARIGELSVHLDETAAQLEGVKRTGKNSKELEQLLRENAVLRNIVVRERQEEARRDEARKLMLAELEKLKIKSDTLNKEIEFLSRPITKLSSEELSLLQQPVVSTSDENRGVITAHFIFAKESEGDSVENEGAMDISKGSKEEMSDAPQSVAHAAKGSFSGTSAGQKPMSENLDQGSE